MDTRSSSIIQVLLADDDEDDRYFFDIALQDLPFSTQLTTVVDGEKLMTYLDKNLDNLPDVLFLDQNMPCKNGLECLEEISQNPKLANLPVVIYSTHLNEPTANLFYKHGAFFYVRKTEFSELKKVLHYVLTLISENKFVQTSRDQFILSTMER